MTKLRTILLLFVTCCSLVMMAANQKKSVTQVTTEVTLTDDVDYQITGTTPFTEEGIVDIVNTDHAVLIMTQIKPSVAISKWLKYVKINGEQARNNTNCQVKLYNRGCIILPYGNSTKPLTVYSEKNFEGDSCNDFGTENNGGYMNTLTAAKLNNRIRSFKLKRGYMVTFSTRGSGRGYSRCFIAADKDIEFAELPPVLDQKITSYRVFKWYDAGKKQIADNLNSTVLNALNVQSSYTWGVGENKAPDYECIPNHIYEDWPSSSAIGQATWSPHTKNNNEPKNTSDDHPQDLETILANWENMMRTGMRLCSPASWDGSDYWNATGFLADFLDSIDARGWRCDIIDLHCYWTEGSFDNIHYWSDKYKRPIWISEWCWGASWNNNGAFAPNVTQAQVKNALQNICTKLNSYNYVERYFYWNGEREISRIYNNGLTPAGEYYASMNAPMAYNGKYDFVPTTPRQYGPTKFTQKVLSTGKTRLSWHDENGEYNQLMEIQMKDATGRWTVLDTITPKEAASNYTIDVDNADESIRYRLHLIDLNGKEYYTSDEISVGDVVEIDGQIYYAGGNMLANGEFDLGFTDWTNGTGNILSGPQFQIVGEGGYQGGSYLQAHLNGAATTVSAVRKVFDLVPGENYMFRVASCNSGNYMKFFLSSDGTTQTKEVARATNGENWTLETFTFNADTYSKGILAFYTLLAKAQIDAVQLHQLFTTREAAVADGIEKARLQAEAQKLYNTRFTAMNDHLTQEMNDITGINDAALARAEKALSNHMNAVKALTSLDVAAATLNAIEQHPCPYYSWMKKELTDALEAQKAINAIQHTATLDSLLATHLSFTRSSKQPKTPSFASEKSDGWEVKVGTFTGGDQKATTKFGKTCWNAWWSTTSKTATMEIRQTVTGLPEGYYELECKATTEHFCISDQHGYLKNGDVEVVTPTLSKDYFDLPVADVWDTLTTAPIYVEANGSLTLGFKSSKTNANTGWWHSFGNASGSKDNREGWWCATGFVLKYHAIDDLTGISLPVDVSKLPNGVFTMDGRQLNQSDNLPRGLYIKVENGRARKVIVK